MLGDGKGNFAIKRGETTGMKADKNAKTIKKIKITKNKTIYLIGNNSTELQVFELQTENNLL